MNRTYSIVWNATRQMWTVASELASGGGKPVQRALRVVALPAVLALFPAGQVAALTPVVDNGTVNNENIGRGERQDVKKGGVTRTTTINGGEQYVTGGGGQL